MDAVLPLGACVAVMVVVGVAIRLAHRRQQAKPLHLGAGTTIAMGVWSGIQRVIMSLLRGGVVAMVIAAVVIVVQWLVAGTPASVFFHSREFDRNFGLYLVGAFSLAIVFAAFQYRAFGAPDRAILAQLEKAAAAMGLRLERNANANATNWIVTHADGSPTHLWECMVDRWWSLTAPDQPGKLMVVNHTPRFLPAANKPGTPDIHEAVGLSLFWEGAPTDDELGRGFEDEVRALGFELRRWKTGLLVSILRLCDDKAAALTIAQVADSERIAALWRLCRR